MVDFMYFSSITQVNLETLGKTIASTDEDLGIAPSAPMIEMIGKYHKNFLFSIYKYLFQTVYCGCKEYLTST